MDENLHYLLHEELEGLFDSPAAPEKTASVGAVTGAAAMPAPQRVTAAEPAVTAASTTTTATAVASPSAQIAELEQSTEAMIKRLIELLAEPKVVQALTRLLGVR
ncbi:MULTISPECIES: hypothetical protein [unclassified Lysobacter]|uniref:hypothetical protein n=1 Tax=unclassified Lysobacter TaxID=2635362 RepID=UPI001BE68456|nr:MULTISPECIES: hypothetical protein [unclassified Lysobacter]MBT2748495.1 hypothetical protein [Lysobacter sp. ISL-42]MBT2752575.1 hypothetical protein [Lysobacter sp. ISL-50]MBT2776696.1 hypothetical protein [Lysobacter sp. ISL-54]MBT2782567.1 hypothetical protein [Lysobacter sp. ISL-52]